MGPGGMDALVTLGAGDMRRSLNILQSAHMAFDVIDEDAVYLCTGNPMPRDIEAVVTWLLNEEFNEAFEREWRLGGRGGGGRGLRALCMGNPMPLQSALRQCAAAVLFASLLANGAPLLPPAPTPAAPSLSTQQASCSFRSTRASRS